MCSNLKVSQKNISKKQNFKNQTLDCYDLSILQNDNRPKVLLNNIDVNSQNLKIYEISFYKIEI